MNESSLSRVYHHTQHRNMGIITAHRRSLTPQENAARNAELHDEIRKHFGLIHIHGSYIENKGTPEESHVKEHSFLVVGADHDDSGHLKGFLRKHGEKYGQDSVLYKAHDSTHAHLIGTKKEAVDPAYHEHKDIGTWHPNRMGDYQSELKGKKGRTFVFESIKFMHGKSFFSRTDREY